LKDLFNSPTACAALLNVAPARRAFRKSIIGGAKQIGVFGSEGFAEVLTGGGWRAVAKQGATSGPGCMNYDVETPPYVEDMARWLDDDKQIHPCNGARAYEGFEITMAMLRFHRAARPNSLAVGSWRTRNRSLEKGFARSACAGLLRCQSQGIQCGIRGPE
jgi:hypothetical protein